MPGRPQNAFPWVQNPAKICRFPLQAGLQEAAGKSAACWWMPWEYPFKMGHKTHFSNIFPPWLPDILGQKKPGIFKIPGVQIILFHINFDVAHARNISRLPGP